MTDKESVLEKENARLRQLLRQAGIDAGASEVAQRLQKLLLAELHHRIKNILSMVQAITLQTLRQAKSLGAAEEAIQHRIMALAHTHDLLLQQNGDTAKFKTLLEGVVGAFGGDGRISITAPEIEIPSAVALSISVVVNELCTNAVKYGALSIPAGHVELRGAVSGVGDAITVTWIESGGPSVQEPAEHGFGTQLIQSATGGDVQLEFKPGGVACEITLRLERRA